MKQNNLKTNIKMLFENSPHFRPVQYGQEIENVRTFGYVLKRLGFEYILEDSGHSIFTGIGLSLINF